MSNLDLQALALLLDGSPAAKSKLKRLAKDASDWIHGRVECPECGSKKNKEHNGCSSDPTWLCTECGVQFVDET